MTDLTAALFVSGGDNGRFELMLVHLEADIDESKSAEAVARGYRYAGYFALMNGEPHVHIEPGFAVAMAYGGALFAGMLGPLIKAEQLKQRDGGKHVVSRV